MYSKAFIICTSSAFVPIDMQYISRLLRPVAAIRLQHIGLSLHFTLIFTTYDFIYHFHFIIYFIILLYYYLYYKHYLRLFIGYYYYITTIIF